MNITKRITKFLLIAALAFPAWNAASAQEVASSAGNEPVFATKIAEGTRVESNSSMRNAVIPQKERMSEGNLLSRQRVVKAVEPSMLKVKKAGNVASANMKTAPASLNNYTHAPKAMSFKADASDIPEGYAKVTLTAGDVWGDGSGYQMLLDADHNTYGTTIPADNNLTTSGDAPASTYALFEYKIPENADGSCSTSNIVLNNSVTILIPAGTYDWCIANPTPGDKIYIASSNGNIPGRYDDYIFNSGCSYEFVVSRSGQNDQVNVEVIDPNLVATPTDLTAEPDYESAEISWVAGQNNESWNLRYRKYLNPEFFDDFESGLNNWTIYTDGTAPQTNGWSAFDAASNMDVGAHSGSYVASSWSWSSNAYNADNWLITPQVTFGDDLKFWVTTAGSWPDSYEVLLSTSGNAESNFTVTLQAMAIAPTNNQWNEVNIDLSAYKGQTGYIAIHHVSEDCNYLFVDDFGIYTTEEWTYVYDVTSPYTIMGLTNKTTYEVQVQGVGNNTTTDWTSSVLFTPDGLEARDIAVGDKEFFENPVFNYDWTDSDGQGHTSKLTDPATDPDQIIAMLQKIYTTKDIPGNLYRGFTEDGVADTHSNVYYGGIGTIQRSNNGNYSYYNGYGWNIGTSKALLGGSSGNYTFSYMDPTEYRPNKDGLTMLLVELVDDFNSDTYETSTATTPSGKLRDYIRNSIKSVRLITEAKRIGKGTKAGTLFKIDCDKMNKFFLMSKGQLRWIQDSYFAETESGSQIGSTYCETPCYIYRNRYVNSFFNDLCHPLFYNMFEQFSPSEFDVQVPTSDIYKDLVAMKSFAIKHDCEGITNIGHQFMMYGSESASADCQDVRDLMFFIPDYRMMTWDNRDHNNYQKFLRYNQKYLPSIALYVIHQDEVESVTKAESYYKLKLTWDSNMDEFLPGEKQEYQLYQVITDEFGVSSWKPVYYTKVVNNQVVYTDKNGNVVTTPVPIVLTLDPSSSKKTYTEVYVQRADASTEVTYAIRGQDTGHFLSLQMSNEQSYVIPGKDPAEMVLMSSATVYSRYEAQNENNCYSNKIQMKAAPKTIKATYLPNGSTMTLNRSYAKVENGNTVTVTEPIATLTINTGTKKFTISGSVLSDVESFFPKGTHDGKTAGYHANSSNQISYTTQTIGGTEYINFDLSIWDNFVANVSKNEHPGLYTYQLNFNAVDFTGLNGTNDAYSNPIRVYVYKTDSQINKPLTLEQVNGDTDCSDAYKPGDVEFSAQVQLSSKSEILRYDAYRWNEGAERSIVDYGGATDEDEEDYDPNGIAGNQGDSYSVTMNAIGSDDYYVGNAVPVTDAAPQNWAKFVDYYPAKQPNGGAFTYAPVVELFTRGYVEGSTTKERGDYNTYGGPLKSIAVGKMELEIDPLLNSDINHSFMSSYKWFDGSEWCAYYNIPIKFKALGIPEGYELYKIRAWRDVDINILREEFESRQGRIAANYLYEDLTYGDDLGGDLTMNKANLYQNNDGTVISYALGSRPIEQGDVDPDSPEAKIEGETHATFGALRINTKDNQPYAIDNLEATIKVRAYFTKSSNPIITESGSKAPSRDLTAADFDYFVADGEVEFKSSDYNQIITGIDDMKSNREVVSVSYVNTIGQVSSTPWKGVNMVVTRYTDGSTSTTKVMK